MHSLAVEEVKSILDNTTVATTAERRGFGTRRGVPDTVVWLSPDHTAFPNHILPVLIELESTFSAAANDFEKFARRYNDTNYRYDIQWPVISEKIDSFRRICKYDIAGIPARRLGRGPAVEEREMYAIIRDWFDEFILSFDNSVSVRQYGDTTVLNWELSFRMYGHKFQTVVPFFFDVGNDINKTIEQYIPPSVLPSVVIINDEYGSKTATISYYKTMIKFPMIRPIRFKK